MHTLSDSKQKVEWDHTLHSEVPIHLPLVLISSTTEPIKSPSGKIVPCGSLLQESECLLFYTTTITTLLSWAKSV